MIISKTPYRISFFGGGTDYPAWFLKEEGVVLSTTIDKYCYLNCRVLPPFFDNKFRIVWSHIETVSTIPEILHPVVREPSPVSYVSVAQPQPLENLSCHVVRPGIVQFELPFFSGARGLCPNREA